MHEVTPGVLQIIAADIEKLLLEKQETIQWAYRKIPDGIKLSLGINIEPSSQGIVVNYTLTHPLEPAPELAQKETVKLKHILKRTHRQSETQIGGEMFKDAKVGDRVWDYNNGWGIIYSINKDKYPITVKFNNIAFPTTYTLNGTKHLAAARPSLFWDEIKIVPPPKPKRMVKKSKEVSMWVNVTPDGFTVGSTPEMAERWKSNNRLGRAHHVTFTHEWEEEE